MKYHIIRAMEQGVDPLYADWQTYCGKRIGPERPATIGMPKSNECLGDLCPDCVRRLRLVSAAGKVEDPEW